MTIDRAIKREQAKAEEYRAMSSEGNAEIAEIYIRCSKYHEQLAEWLEELKAYKEKPEGWMWDEAEKKGYNKSIDDFTEAVKELIVDLSVIRFKDIDEIAEQLKEGESDGNG